MNEQKVITRMPSIEECMQESWGLADELKSFLLPDRDGTIWQPIGTLPFSPAYARFFQTVWFNKIQRWQSDLLWRVNSYAKAIINNLTTMTMGSGFQYQCENESMQNRLDAFLHRTKFKKKSRRSFVELLTWGETFYRQFGDDLRFVHPDLVYDPLHMGIEQDPEDYETIERYWIMGKPVDASEVQHRKLGWEGEKRGVSILFAIASHLTNAEQLLDNLTRTADQQSRFAFIRKHKGNQQAVEQFRSQIVSNEPASILGPCTSRDTYENYRPGSIIDIGDGTEWDSPGAAIDASKYVDVLHAIIRLCAASVSLPEYIIGSSQDDMGAYNASLVADGHSTKAMEVWQEKLAEWDLELFEMFGFDSSKIKVIKPEIALHDKNQTVLQGNFLLDRKLASKSTVAKMFDINYKDELEQMELEPEEELPEADPLVNENPEISTASLDTKDKPQETNEPS